MATSLEDHTREGETGIVDVGRPRIGPRFITPRNTSGTDRKRDNELDVTDIYPDIRVIRKACAHCAI